MLEKGFNALDDDEDNTVANIIILKHYFIYNLNRDSNKARLLVILFSP